MKLSLRNSPPRNEIFVEMRFPPEELESLNVGHPRISKRHSLDATVATAATNATMDMSSCSDAAVGVRFDLEGSIHIPIPALADMAYHERRSIWYTRENYDVIMGANNITAKLMRIGRENPESFGHCFRGLEHRIAECRKSREERTRNASRAVLQEQTRQSESGVTDQRSLAKLYRLATLSALEIALSRAEADAKAAALYQEEHASSTPPPQQVLKSSPDEPTPSFHTNSPSEGVLNFKVAISEDDEVSVLSDEGSTILYASEGHGLVSRLRHLIQKQPRSSGSSRASSVSDSFRKQRSRR